MLFQTLFDTIDGERAIAQKPDTGDLFLYDTGSSGWRAMTFRPTPKISFV